VASAIEVCGVSKRFRLFHEYYTGWRDRLRNFGRIPSEPFWALDDINFTVERGSTMGLLGHNGSGKSTLLKCVAGILQPTTGEIHTHGRLAALLELGAGFNPELTGRENIFMNASILGLTKRETQRIFDDIVAFAELDKFIDMQVRHYSSGMYVRLGFAVAVNVDPDILLVDEVLSVGDEAFQRKCLDRVAKFQREGRTILVVTHAADLVRRICDRAVVLDHGQMVCDAPPGEAVRAFRETMERHTADDDHDVEFSSRVKITKVTIEHPGLLVDRNWLLPNESMTVRVAYRALEPTEDLLIGISIYDQIGNHLFGTNTKNMDIEPPVEAGDCEACFEFDNVPLLDGTYLLTIAIQSGDEGTVYDWREQQDQFAVMNPSRAAGLVSLPVEVRFGTRAAWDRT
jgi:ABC-2 type transport system ATP-binding protein